MAVRTISGGVMMVVSLRGIEHSYHFLGSPRALFDASIKLVPSFVIKMATLSK